jgi:hypothetical protein
LLSVPGLNKKENFFLFTQLNLNCGNNLNFKSVNS